MPVFSTYAICRLNDGALTVQLVQPTAIGGWSLRTDFSHRLNGTPFVSKYLSSGQVNGTSGITVMNSGAGVFKTEIDPKDTSGIDYCNVAYNVVRTDSGFYTTIAQGYEVLYPG